jgi:hypothetical protein
MAEARSRRHQLIADGLELGRRLFFFGPLFR